MDIKIHLISIGEIEDQYVTRYADFCWIITENEFSPPDGWGILNLRNETQNDGKMKYTVKAVVYPKPQKAINREDVIYAAALK